MCREATDKARNKIRRMLVLWSLYHQTRIDPHSSVGRSRFAVQEVDVRFPAESSQKVKFGGNGYPPLREGLRVSITTGFRRPGSG